MVGIGGKRGGDGSTRRMVSSPRRMSGTAHRVPREMHSAQQPNPILRNPHDRNVPASTLSVAIQRALVLVFLALMIVVAVFLLLDRWRRGCLVLSAGLVYLGVIRWLVDSRYMGVLAVRSRKFDSCFTIIIGLLIAFLALSVDSLL